MPVRFPETETKTPTDIHRGHQYRQDLQRNDLQGRHRQDHHRRDTRQDHNHHSHRDQDSSPDPDSDSDLIFAFEMEDSQDTTGRVNTRGMDPEEYLASLTHPTTAELELFSSLRPATNAEGPLEQSEQSTTAPNSQDQPASPESTPVRRYQPARPQFWSHSSGLRNTSNFRTPTATSTLRGGSHPVTSREAYSPLAPHAHQLHQGHRYVTGRGFGSPGWNPTGGSYGGNRNASSNNHRSDSQRGNHGNQSRQGQSGQGGQTAQNGQGTSYTYQAWQTQPPQNAPAWPGSQQPQLQRQPSQYQQFVTQNPQRHWHYYGPYHRPPGAATSVSTSPWNPYNPLLDHTLHESHRIGGGQAQVGIATSMLGHDPGANLDASKSEPAAVPIRCLIVNGSKRRYDVDMLNRLAWGDLATLPVGAEAALCVDGARVDAGAGVTAGPLDLGVSVSLPSMVSDNGTLTCQSSLVSDSRLQILPVVPSLNSSEITATEVTPDIPPIESQAQTEAQTSTSLITTSVAHHWLLKLPSAFWPRLAQYVDDETLSKLSTINRVFANARVERVLRSKKREARVERVEQVDRQEALENLSRLERLQRLQRIERLAKVARLAEQEERMTFATSQLDRLSLSPVSPHPSGSTGSFGRSNFSAFSSSSSNPIPGQWPHCPKACFRCFRVRQQTHFPRVLVLSMAARGPENTAVLDESPMPANDRAALSKIVARYLESKALAEPLAERRHQMMCRPMFVPYIPIPADVAVGSVGTSGDGSHSHVPTSETAHTEDESSHLGRCCFECAISAGLIKPGERIVALDGSWRWVCRYGLAHAGGNDDICQQRHDEM